MAFAAVAAAPQVLEEAHKTADKVAELWAAILDNAALTRETGYRGAIPLGILTYYGVNKYVKPPVQTAWSITQKVDKVLSQLYTWLGGAASDLAGIEKTVGQDVSKLESYF